MAGAAVVDRPGGDGTCADETEAAARLQQKEQDLLLAAQLGQALLQKNEQLSAENESRAAEYARHIEALEQERHSLRLEMSAMQVEHEAQVLQLQADIKAVREQIERQQHSGKDTDKQRSQILNDLTEQNQRLTRQLREAGKSEKQLHQQIEQLRQQQQLRTDSFQFHTSSVDAMRQEIAALSDQRQDLERRQQLLLEERNHLIDRLHEASERQMILERERQERSGEVRSSRRKVDHLVAANNSLTERLDAAAGLSPLRTGAHPLSSATICSSMSGHNTSLKHELDSSVDEGIGSGTTGSHLPSVEVTMMELGGDVSVEDDDQPATTSETHQALVLLRQEVQDTTAQMGALTELTRERAAEAPTTDPEVQMTTDTAPEQSAPSHLREVLAVLRAHVLTLLPEDGAQLASGDCCTVCSRPQPAPLETQLAAVRRQYDQLQQQYQLQNNTLEQLADELERHRRQITMREKQYAALGEEKAMLKAELDEAYVAKEDLVRKAWEARDQAVQRKNTAELELSRVRIDVLQANSQLLESIQCKVRLSCQLDQWQWDMQQLVDSEIQQKLDRSERHNTRSTTPTSRASALMRFFGRS